MPAADALRRSAAIAARGSCARWRSAPPPRRRRKSTTSAEAAQLALRQGAVRQRLRDVRVHRRPRVDEPLLRRLRPRLAAADRQRARIRHRPAGSSAASSRRPPRDDGSRQITYAGRAALRLHRRSSRRGLLPERRRSSAASGTRSSPRQTFARLAARARTRSPRARGCGRRCRADRRARAPALVDVAADREPRLLRPRSPRGSRCCRGGRRRSRRRRGPCGGEWTTSTPPSGQPASRSAASSSVRSKLQSQGVIGTPAPRPKNCDAVDLGRRRRGGRWRRSQPAAASRSASSVSLLPGTSTVGASIAASASIVSARPSWIEAKSPAADHDVGVGAELDQAGGAVEVAVQVGEGEDPHRRQPTRVGRRPRLPSPCVADPVAGVAEVHRLVGDQGDVDDRHRDHGDERVDRGRERDQREQDDRGEQALAVERADVSQPEGDMADQIERGAAAERDRGHRLQRLVGVQQRLLQPERDEHDAGDQQQVQDPVGVAREPGLGDAGRRRRSGGSATSATTSKYAHHWAAGDHQPGDRGRRPPRR